MYRGFLGCADQDLDLDCVGGTVPGSIDGTMTGHVDVTNSRCVSRTVPGC